MSRIPVKTVNSPRKVLNHLSAINAVCARTNSSTGVSAAAWEGHELEDWLAAEREALYSPRCIL